MKELQPSPSCYNDQGVEVNPEEYNCTAKTVDGVTLSAFQERCDNGKDFVTIRDAQGNMVQLLSRSLCYDDPSLYVEDDSVVFSGNNEHGIYIAPVAPAYTATPVPPETTRVLVPTHTPPPTTETPAFLGTPQPIIEVHHPPQPGCFGIVALALLPIALTLHNVYTNRKR